MWNLNQITEKIKVPKKLECLFITAKRYIDIYGGRGSAKSHTIATFLLSKALEKKCRILCTREIQNSIRDSVWKLLSDKITEYGWDDFFDVKNDSIICKKTGSEFIFKGLLRNINDIKSMEGIDFCWVEEAQSVSRKSLEILIPTIRKPKSQIIFSYNPTNDRDPVHVDYTLADRDDCLKVEINYSDNRWFPEVLKKEMEYDRSHDLDKYYHIWEGKTVVHSQAQVFYGKWAIDEFEAPEKTFFLFGADWGFSNDPTCLVRCYNSDGKLFIDYETWGIGIDIDKLPDMFSNIPESKKFHVTADSARPETISYIQKRGFPLIRPAVKGKGSVEDGIAFLRGFAKIIIHPRCKHTIDEFRTYSYKTDPITGEISNKLEDKNNHLIDSLRYATEHLNLTASKEVYNRFGVRV